MRADRLVAALLVLQAKGRVSARALAEELEVSVKTARRDLEALAAAGIPVYAQAGRNGGWSLLGGARTDLSGLTAAEARALFLIAGPSASLAPNARAGLRKLVRALPEPFRDQAMAAASAVVLDPASWGGEAPRPEPFLELLQQAVIDGRQVRISYVDRRRATSERTVHPLGLVRKGASWYLLGGTDAGERTFNLARIGSVQVLDATVVRPEGFDLRAAWRGVVQRVEAERRHVRALVRVPEAALEPLGMQFGADLELVERPAGGRALVAISAAWPTRIAEQLAGWGALLLVVEPDAVRDELARIARELAELYGRAPEASSGDST